MSAHGGPPLTSLYATRSSSPVQERTHKGNSRRNRLFREERRVSFKRDSDEENIRQVQHLLERNDLGRNSELRKQEQEIERLERKLAKYHERPSVSPDERESKPIRHEEVWNSDSEESDMDRRRKATRRRERMSRHEEGRRRRSEAEVPSMRDQRLEREAEQRERLKARFAREREEEWYHGVKTDDERARPVRQEYSRVRDEEESRRRSEAARRLNRLEKMEKEEEEDNRVYRWRFKKMEGEESVSQESEMKDKSDISAASMEMVRRESWQRARDEDRHDSFSLADTSSEHQDILITTPSTENTMMERVEDDIPGKISGELSLPDSLEDLLIQWTTLDRQEIQRG
ncbi:hypothetical protein N7533_013682 [Penicillium manginii]|uniref:uncharacterized protein n=1 Tax=Penicillium manginii TaxID=203109 RepID=UPI0025475301|nr:uncharacterized protein N7533_013682 [Penicillium manginii]KAJ5733235.1 hypothetical protein N7533_013682 [Penicillium manginii]